MNKVIQVLKKKGKKLNYLEKKNKLLYLSKSSRNKKRIKFFRRNSAKLISTVYQKHSPCNNQRCNLPNDF